jgi:predicted nucleic acid-binding Zn ribbon protein
MWSIGVLAVAAPARYFPSLMRKFTSLKDVLPLALGQVAYSTTSAGPLKVIWDALVGAAIANNTTPVSLHGGTLLIETQNRAWADELTRQTPDLLPKLQAQLGGSRVLRALTFKVKG